MPLVSEGEVRNTYEKAAISNLSYVVDEIWELLVRRYCNEVDPRALSDRFFDTLL